MNQRPETLVATVPMAPVSVLVLGVFVALLAVTSFLPWTIRLIVVAVGSFATYRLLRQVAAMKLAVNDWNVLVVNFRDRHELDLWSVRIEVRDDPTIWPKDDLRATMREAFGQKNPPQARMLVLTDSSGQQVS